MHSFEDKKIIPFDAKLVHSVVMDIEKYPEFLPWCDSATIISGSEDDLTASLKLGFKGFGGSYVSRVLSSSEDGVYTVKTEAISGMFEYLRNNWEIKPVNNSAEVTFYVAFKMKSGILDSVIGIVFEEATKKIMEAFEKRMVLVSSQIV